MGRLIELGNPIKKYNPLYSAGYLLPIPFVFQIHHTVNNATKYCDTQ